MILIGYFPNRKVWDNSEDLSDIYRPLSWAKFSKKKSYFLRVLVTVT
jgi:hypothetical protein